MSLTIRPSFTAPVAFGKRGNKGKIQPNFGSKTSLEIDDNILKERVTEILKENINKAQLDPQSSSDKVDINPSLAEDETLLEQNGFRFDIKGEKASLYLCSEKLIKLGCNIREAFDSSYKIMDDIQKRINQSKKVKIIEYSYDEDYSGRNSSIISGLTKVNNDITFINTCLNRETSGSNSDKENNPITIYDGCYVD